jgi:hypothetical protein
MRMFLAVIFVLIVLALGSLEVIASRSFAPPPAEPNRSASTPSYWR